MTSPDVTQVADDCEHLIIETGPEQEHLFRQVLFVSDSLLIPVGAESD